jgi:hypothetical protein
LNCMRPPLWQGPGGSSNPKEETSTSPPQLRALSCMVWPRKFKLVQRRRETSGPRCIKHRGARLCLASAGFCSCPCEDVWTSAAHFQDSLRPNLRAPESRHDFRFVGDAGQRAAWQRSTLDPHRDPAPGKVIRSCPVASFDLLTKIDPAETISASAAHA